MRPDQFDKLKALQKRLVDELISEADPKKWPATDSAQGRGDRYWLQKNCRSTLALVDEIGTFVRREKIETEDPAEIERLTREAEAEARRVLEKCGIPIGDDDDEDNEDE